MSRGRAMAYWGPIVVLGLAVPQVSRAAQVCAQMNQTMDQARAMQNEGMSTWPQAWTLYLTVAGFDVPFENCSSNDDQAVCFAEFGLSDEASTRVLAYLDAEITVCLGELGERIVDTGVNHPDIYDAFLYQHPSIEISLARKRKSALGKTVVTFRATDKRS